MSGWSNPVEWQGTSKHSEGQGFGFGPFCLEDTAIAHIETIQTGFHVVTHVQGRVYRQQAGQRKPEQSLKARTGAKAKQRRRVCLLSARDARWLEDHGVSQPCFGSSCTHAHHTRARIEVLVKSGELRWIGESKNVAAWPEARVWKGVPSGGPMGPKVMQLVSI
jgi:hypothetical protein